MSPKKANREIRAISVVVEPRTRPKNNVEVRVINLHVVTSDGSVTSKLRTSQYPISRKTVTDFIEQVCNNLFDE